MKLQMGVALMLAGMMVGCEKQSSSPVEPPAQTESSQPMPGAEAVPIVQTQPVIPTTAPATAPAMEPMILGADPIAQPENPGMGERVSEAMPPGDTTAPPAETIYLVKQGDSLYSIARAHYGSGIYYSDILAANPGLTTQLTIGQKIILPAIPDKPPAISPTSKPMDDMTGDRAQTGNNPQPVIATQPGQTIYIVKEGDSLYRIAKEYYGDGERYKDILAANPGLTTNLQIGQEIILPPISAGE